jgi:Uma2 family endonuclease
VSDAAEVDGFDALYARYRELPEGTKAELVAGEVRVLPRPAPRHVRSAGKLFGALDGTYGFDSDDGPGGWVILIEPEIRFGDEIRAPDIVGWHTERYDEPESGPFLVAPDWVCEVLSPSTAAFDRKEKLPLFARHGVSHVWLVDPTAETLEVYRRQSELWLLLATHGGDEAVRAEPFDAVSLDLGALWRVPSMS